MRSVNSEPLSFCMVTTFYPPHHFGGDAMYVYRLSNALARRGHRVTVVYSVDAYRTLGGPPPAGPYPNHERVTVAAVSSRVPPVPAMTTYLTGRPPIQRDGVKAILDDTPFDVVHFHNVSLVGGPGVLSHGSGVKLYTLHEHWLVCPMHVLWKNNRELCERPRCIPCSLAYRRPPQLWRYTGLLERQLEHVDLFLAPSAFTADEHARRGLRLPVRVLPYFLADEETEVDGEREFEHPRPYFLFVGRLERLKGIETLLEVFRDYDRADLVIAGNGRLARRVRREAARLPHVHLLGFVHPAQLRSLYAGAIGLVVPSLCYEVFGIVALEAFAQRTPVIVRDRGGLGEVVRESGGGFAYRTDDELIEAMERLRTDAEGRSELGESGHRAFLERWIEQPHIDAYFDAIEAARSGGRAPLHDRV